MIYVVNYSRNKNNLDFKNQNGSDRKSQVQLYLQIPTENHQSLQMTPENVYYPKQLYKGVIYTKGGNNKMMYLGMQNQAFSFPMFDAQALWSLQYILKNITIPCKADMLSHIKTWSQR